MSEYIEIETETTEDPDRLLLVTNLSLSGEEDEVYSSVAAMEEGTPLAQALAYIAGIRHVQISGSELVVTRDPDMPWHVLVADLSAAIKDFFL
jgi:hypothetical protein